MVFCKRLLKSGVRILITGLFSTLVLLFVQPHNWAMAADRYPDEQPYTLQGKRLTAVIDCIPKELSRSNLGRALTEMGNDQLQRAFNLTDNPKLSEAELEFNNCLKRKGFTTPQDLREAIVDTE